MKRSFVFYTLIISFACTASACSQDSFFDDNFVTEKGTISCPPGERIPDTENEGQYIIKLESFDCTLSGDLHEVDDEKKLSIQWQSDLQFCQIYRSMPELFTSDLPFPPEIQFIGDANPDADNKLDATPLDRLSETAKANGLCPKSFPLCAFQTNPNPNDSESTFFGCSQPCPEDWIECDGKCINPEISLTHCGANGSCSEQNPGKDFQGAKCKKHEICDDGECLCAEDMIKCDGSCIFPLSAPNYCGASGSCTSHDPNDDDFAGEICDENSSCYNGHCISHCQNSLTQIDPSLNTFATCLKDDTPVCTDLASDLLNCGQCGHSCILPQRQGVLMSCDNGQCAYKCSEGYTEVASGTLFCLPDTSSNDPEHCGPNQIDETTGSETPNRCNTPQICQNGECIDNLCAESSQCPASDGSCMDYSPSACGPSCINCYDKFHGVSALCQNNQCIISQCKPGFHLENKSCVPNSDTACADTIGGEIVNCTQLSEEIPENLINNPDEIQYISPIFQCNPEGQCVKTSCPQQTGPFALNQALGLCQATNHPASCGGDFTNCKERDPQWLDGSCENQFCKVTACKNSSKTSYHILDTGLESYCIPNTTEQCNDTESYCDEQFNTCDTVATPASPQCIENNRPVEAQEIIDEDNDTIPDEILSDADRLFWDLISRDIQGEGVYFSKYKSCLLDKCLSQCDIDYCTKDCEPEPPSVPAPSDDQTNPNNPDNPGDETDPNNPDNPGDETDPNNPDNPGDETDPELIKQQCIDQCIATDSCIRQCMSSGAPDYSAQCVIRNGYTPLHSPSDVIEYYDVIPCFGHPGETCSDHQLIDGICYNNVCIPKSVADKSCYFSLDFNRWMDCTRSTADDGQGECKYSDETGSWYCQCPLMDYTFCPSEDGDPDDYQCRPIEECGSFG